VGDRGSLAHGGLGLALARLGMVACEQGDDARATIMWEECLSLHQALGDREGVAVALLGLADVARDRGDTARVRALCDDALPVFRALGARWAIGFALNDLALADYQEGNAEAAAARAAEGVALFREMRSASGLAEALATRGYARRPGRCGWRAGNAVRIAASGVGRGSALARGDGSGGTGDH